MRERSRLANVVLGDEFQRVECAELKHRRDALRQVRAAVTADAAEGRTIWLLVLQRRHDMKGRQVVNRLCRQHGRLRACPEIIFGLRMALHAQVVLLFQPEPDGDAAHAADESERDEHREADEPVLP